MLAFRGFSGRCRIRGHSFWTARVCCRASDVGGCPEDYYPELSESQGKPLNRLFPPTRFYSSTSSCLRSYGNMHEFSVQAGAESGEEEADDLEDGFSELETPHCISEETASQDENHDDEVLSEPALVEEDDVFDGEETLTEEKKRGKGSDISGITKALFDAPSLPVSNIMDKWVEEGNEVTITKASSAMLFLRRRKMFLRALQLSEWLESRKPYELTDKFYSSHVDLLAKVRGIPKAEEYINRLPTPLKTELVYRSLLANCISRRDVKKSEEIFDRMKESNLRISCFSCNQMLLLYKKTNKKKLADILMLMEEEKIKPSLFTYYLLIDVKGQAKDIQGMEMIAETMKTEGLETTPQIQGLMARHYAGAGLKDKAEALLNELEGDDLTKTRQFCQLLLPAYASLGRDDEVDRVWKASESDPSVEKCISAVEAWGQLKKVEKAEAVFEKMLKKLKKPPSRYIALMLRVYANNKMLTKGKDLVKRMADLDCRIGPLTWDGLVRLYVGAGEVEKADSIMTKAIKQKKGRPLYQTFMLIMDKYAERGDVHNAEKLFLMTKEAGYVAGGRQYQTLLDAYANAKVPAYGIVDRMKADQIFVSKALAAQVARLNAFKQSAVLELLD